MSTETFSIHRWDTGAVIASVEAETLKEALEKLVKGDQDLYRASLDGARLDFFKNDLWAILLRVPHEINGLVLALEAGRVDGSVYEGECACLVGTIANVRGCKYSEIPGLEPNSGRPAEQWFMGIRKGDTPDKSAVVKLTMSWIEEFVALMKPLWASQ